MKHVLRMATGIPFGKIILDYIRGPEARKLLCEAAETGRPPIGAISQRLRELVKADVLEQMLVKQFCGRAIRAVLAEEGFVPDQLGVRVRRDPVFATGTAYVRRVEEGPKTIDTLLKRTLDTLSFEEMRWAASYLAQRIDLLDSQQPRPETRSDHRRRRRRPKREASPGA